MKKKSVTVVSINGEVIGEFTLPNDVADEETIDAAYLWSTILTEDPFGMEINDINK